ncbi:MAG: hypothetical protein LBE49_05305, partial [Deltaproteobacteria bacterium]|nr:hypothetical protein [Deltaproteobacteria bacterium]
APENENQGDGPDYDDAENAAGPLPQVIEHIPLTLKVSFIPSLAGPNAPDGPGPWRGEPLAPVV